jgi:hypothetical protein
MQIEARQGGAAHRSLMAIEGATGRLAHQHDLVADDSRVEIAADDLPVGKKGETVGAADEVDAHARGLAQGHLPAQHIQASTIQG